MSVQRFRLPTGGGVDRTRFHAFRFDGRTLTGHPGDTLASALLANGVHLVGRSFKYHRPRGIVSAGVEEASALVQLREGARSEPNQRATVVELYDGLVAASQNRWPSLGLDLGAVNNLLSPLFPAGFYYKTFMWPASLWHTYEQAIRAMAGLGRAAEAPDPDRYERHHAHCDVLVIGGGPAGLSAARAAARTGARVILVEQDFAWGGALLREPAVIDGESGEDWLAQSLAELAEAGEVRTMTRTTVIGSYGQGAYLMLERHADHLAVPEGDEPRQRLWRVRAKRTVLAAGAIERPLVFANNDRPGIMLAGAGASYARRFAVRTGERPVIVTNNDSAYRAALAIAEVGGTVAALVDSRTDAPAELAARVNAAGIRLHTGYAPVEAEGGRRVSGLTIAPVEADGRLAAGRAQRLKCDAVLMSGGWNPTAHLYAHANGRLRFDAERHIYLPDASREPIRVAGAAAGLFGLQAALDSGAEAGHDAAADAGFRKPGPRPRQPAVETVAETPARPLWVSPASGRSSAKRFVDMQNDVTVADLELALREGYRSIEHVKRYTTTGMGTDQGKTSNVNALAVVNASLGEAAASTGYTTFRPPYTPATFGAIAGRDVGPLLDPVRRTAMQDWHGEHGAVFEPVGQWRRPLTYLRDGEDEAAAVQRECRAVRQGLGALDASKLGKIDIQGPDAAEFLNRIYTNGWSKLEIGRCRYGVMLHEDGMVFDDGVTARLGANHFHMTTTSGGAAGVLGWLENWLQTEWPELRVWCNSMTEHWAVVNIAGPHARDLMTDLCQDVDLAPEAFPFMAVREGTVAGLPARIFRISITGELSYEINVPARYGLELWRAVMTAGAAYGITPYGTEAMHVLRCEVGFIMVGQETDGTVTPVDLGMEWLVSTRKDFIGKRSLARADTARADRKQLVGLLAQDPQTVLAEGAQIVTAPQAAPQRSEGHVTSSYMSPNVGRSIAMALLERGGSRHGETVNVVWDGRVVPAEVTQPKFFDLEGARSRG